MNKKMLMIVIAVALIAGGGGAAAAWLLRPAPPPPTAAEGADAAMPAANTGAAPGIVMLEPFLTNVADPTADRYARLSLRLAVTPASMAAEIEDDDLLEARIRDRVLFLLAQKSAAELTTPLGKEGLRRELKAQLTTLLQEGEITEVLLTDLIVQ